MPKENQSVPNYLTLEKKHTDMISKIKSFFARKVKTAPQTYNPPIKISVINATTVLLDTDITPVVSALQIQASRDFAPVYGIDAKLTQIPKGQTAPAGTWQIVLMDTSDVAGALGYHDLTSDGLPISKCFIKTDMDNGAVWSVTVSHEMVEMMADPWINLTVFVQTTNTAGKLYAYEVADAPEADRYAYLINGVKVSNFVHPAWFGVAGSKDKLDHLGLITTPLALLPGGYISIFDVTNSASGWTQVTADKVIHQHRTNFKHGSRRERRQRGHANWKKSL